ncbi:MAG: NAD(P)/FAD-dependent oxidoreductase [Campylobacterales bacterium]|nr:NAD(P)/FAD-dependent oxidoreductase [Campylobacterales bacterium]
MAINLAVIGGGASGLISAIVSARNGAKVTIFEQNNKLGKRILATGNGRCNISNQKISFSNFYSSDLTVVKNLLSKFSTKDCIDFFRSIDLEIVEGDNSKLFPMSLQASSVVDLLEFECHRLEVNVLLDTPVKSIKKEKQGFTVNNKKFDKVVLATGGLSASHLGSGEGGYEIARSLGHTIRPTYPSLVQLISKESTKTSSGVKVVGNIRVLIDNQEKTSKTGDILFTDYGISGSAILDVSRIASKALFHNEKVEVVINLLPNFSKEKLKNFLQSRVDRSKNQELSIWLEGILNKKLIKTVLKQTGFEKKKVSDLKTKDIQTLIFAIQNIKLTITDTKGFKNSEVTAGGVSTKEINPKTFESKIVKDLYIVGETLDVDGDCGGYNLHFAWGSGLIASSLS